MSRRTQLQESLAHLREKGADPRMATPEVPKVDLPWAMIEALDKRITAHFIEMMADVEATFEEIEFSPEMLRQIAIAKYLELAPDEQGRRGFRMKDEPYALICGNGDERCIGATARDQYGKRSYTAFGVSMTNVRPSWWAFMQAAKDRLTELDDIAKIVTPDKPGDA